MSGACQPSSADQPVDVTNDRPAVPPASETFNHSKGDTTSKIIHVNQQQFQTEVTQSKIPVVVDFYATWCPPCRALVPILDRLANEFDGRIKFVKVNSDEEHSLASEYNVTALPTLVLIEDGLNRGQLNGLPQEETLREQLNQWVKSRKETTA